MMNDQEKIRLARISNALYYNQLALKQRKSGEISEEQFIKTLQGGTNVASDHS